MYKTFNVHVESWHKYVRPGPVGTAGLLGKVLEPFILATSPLIGGKMKLFIYLI